MKDTRFARTNYWVLSLSYLLYFSSLLVSWFQKCMSLSRYPQTKILTNVLVEASSEENEPSPSKPHQNEDKKFGFEPKNQPKPHQ